MTAKRFPANRQCWACLRFVIAGTVLLGSMTAWAQSGAPLPLLPGPTAPQAGTSVSVPGGAAFASGNLITTMALPVGWSSCSGLAASVVLFYNSAAALNCAEDTASSEGFGCGVTGPGARLRLNADGSITIREQNLESRTFTASGSNYVRSQAEQNRFDFDVLVPAFSSSNPSVIVSFTENAHDGRWRTFTDIDNDGVTFVETAFGNRTSDYVQYDYSPDEKLITRVSDAQGRQATFSASTQQGPSLITGITGPDGTAAVLSYSQNADGKFDLTSIQLPGFTSGASMVTTLQFDASHLLRSTSSPAAGLTTYAYDNNGRIASVVDRQGQPLAFTYYADQFSVVDGYFQESDQKFVGGVMVKQIGADGLATNYVYDSSNRVIQVSNALGDTTKYAYTGNDLTQVTDLSLGQTMTLTYNGTHDVLTNQDYLGRTTQLTRNSFGQPLTILDPTGITTTITYDATGTVTAISADGKTQTAVNNGYGLPTSVIAADGRTTSYQYDAYCNVTKVTLPCPDGSILRSATSTGLLLSTTDPAGVVTQYTYNDAHLVTRISNSLGQSTSYSYGTDGNPVEVNDRGNDWTGSWDPNTGQLASSALNGISDQDSPAYTPTQTVPQAAPCSTDCAGFCGSVSLCGQTVDCGTCSGGKTCSANNQCVMP